jgi:hypothetical protein
MFNPWTFGCSAPEHYEVRRCGSNRPYRPGRRFKKTHRGKGSPYPHVSTELTEQLSNQTANEEPEKARSPLLWHLHLKGLDVVIPAPDTEDTYVHEPQLACSCPLAPGPHLQPVLGVQ